MRRHTELRSLDEAMDSAVQNEIKLAELRIAKRAGRLEIARNELELKKKKGAVSLRYYKTKMKRKFSSIFENAKNIYAVFFHFTGNELVCFMLVSLSVSANK